MYGIKIKKKHYLGYDPFGLANINIFVIVTVMSVVPAMSKFSAECAPKSSKPELTELQTAPFDPRFPNTNQTKYCWQSYLDWHRCTRLKGEGYKPCEYFKKCYQSMCPNAWVEKWDSQIEEGRFPGKLE